MRTGWKLLQDSIEFYESLGCMWPDDTYPGQSEAHDRTVWHQRAWFLEA